MKKMLSLAISVLCLVASHSSWADLVYVCQHSDAVRKIIISYEQEGAAVPCAVTYEKDDSVQTLWSAQAQEGYCEEKAASFVEKQQGWGWSCAETVAESASESDDGASEAAEAGTDGE